jgi:hypothetical protein
MSEITKQSVWTSYISARQARRVARALRAAGYGKATADLCRGYVINVAEYFEPADASAQRDVLRLICEAAGIQPKQNR